MTVDNKTFDSILEQGLEYLQRKKTTILLSNFMKFVPLFQTHNLDVNSVDYLEYTNKLKPLVYEYYNTVDVYSSINVVDDNTNEVVVVLPPVYRNSSLLSNDIANDNSSFHFYAGHDFPGIAKQAFDQLTHGYIKSQNLTIEELQQERKSQIHKELDVLKVTNPEKFNYLLGLIKDKLQIQVPDTKIDENETLFDSSIDD